MRPALVWLRQDLRLADNPALSKGIEPGRPVIPVFIWAPEEEGDWPPGGASRWWLHQSLKSLHAELQALGSALVIRKGPTLDALHHLCEETQAAAVFWNRRYEPAAIARDRQVKESLRGAGLDAESFNAALLHEPWTIRNKSGNPFQVFTPFWRHCLDEAPPPPAPLPTPQSIPAPARWPATITLSSLGLEPHPNWAGGIQAAWQPGAAGAARQLDQFLCNAFEFYDQHRNRPDLAGTSRLSPHLHYGEISPRLIWHALHRMAEHRGMPASTWHHSQFLTEIGWREFSHHLLFHFPHTPHEPLRSQFTGFPWRTKAKALVAWQQGQTGYPIVDAGMRELWTTGWMHNRVRMMTASFLVKDLLISWQKGAAWFWDTLVDADLAQNTLGWQWTAGCGADAAPYFRVFNPTAQGEKFDPNGEYVRRWCPELAKLPPKWIHRPSLAPGEVLKAAGVELGRNYPEPIVNHTIARQVALEAYSRTRE